MAINIPGYEKVESEVLYDTQNVTSGQSSDLTFFAQSISGSTTYATTNMLQARRLPGNEEFGVRNFESIAAAGSPPEDIAAIYQNGWIEVVLNRETPFALALRFIPSGAAIHGIDNRAAAAGQAGAQWYANGRLFRLAKSLRMSPDSTFHTTLKFGTAPALVATRALTLGYHGVRASQGMVQ